MRPHILYLYFGRWTMILVLHRNVHMGWWRHPRRIYGPTYHAYGCPWLTVEFLKCYDHLASRWGVSGYKNRGLYRMKKGWKV